MMKQIKILCAFLLSAVLLTACGKEDSNALKVGTIAGPETQLMEVARDVALKEHGVEITIVTFEDYVLPNSALNDGLIDANAFQTEHYFEKILTTTGYDLANAGYTFIYPVGVYSTHYKSIHDLPNGARIGIPNNASNEPRTLLVLAQAGLLALNDTPKGADYSVFDIKDNPKQLQIIPLDAAQLPRMLGDLDAAVINTNYALPAGLLPSRDAIFVEKVNPLYANIIAVRHGEEQDPRIVALVQSYQSQAVVDLAQKLFQGQAVAAWEYLK